MIRAALAALLLLPAGASASAGRIAYSRYSDDFASMDVVVAHADGSHARQLTHEPKGVKDYDPKWSPDRKRILFERDAEDGTAKLVVMRADGSHQRELDTRCTGRCDADAAPSWTPDGRHIAYTRVVGPYDRPHESARSAVLWVVRADGSHRRRLSQRGIDGRFEDYHAQWAADRSYETFLRSSDASGHSALFRMRPDATHVRRLTPWKLDADLPDLGADGRIAFETYGHGGRAQNVAIVSSRCRRCRVHLVTHNAAKSRVNATNPTWAGRRIVEAEFTVQSGEDTDDGVPAELYSLRADGTHRRNLTRSDAWELRPDWAAAPARASAARARGGRLVYAKELDGAGFQLFVSRADGTHERQITHLKGQAEQPDWSPDVGASPSSSTTSARRDAPSR